MPMLAVGGITACSGSYVDLEELKFQTAILTEVVGEAV